MKIKFVENKNDNKWELYVRKWYCWDIVLAGNVPTIFDEKDIEKIVDKLKQGEYTISYDGWIHKLYKKKKSLEK